MIYALVGIAAAFCAWIQWGDEIPLPHQDYNKKVAKYELNVKKQDEKDNFKKAVLNRHPSGYMTVEEYEILSAPKDRMKQEIEIPKVPIPSDMLYVPQPAYKIVRYNNPPGSPELTLYNSFYERRQQNAQGIVSPDFTKLVYSSVYYYPNSGSTACDVFVIKLDKAKSNMDKILTANAVHRYSEPILSTDKDNENYYTFRTITPVDFSSDGSKILLKEKIGNTKDGIWKTTPFVYDFKNNVSYNLKDVRESIKYYWQAAREINLDDKRWDITPLGFSQKNPDWVIVTALAYTGEKPVNLGTWAISYTGEAPRLVSTTNSTSNISMNGYKLIKSGVEPANIVKREQREQKRIDKSNARQAKKEDKAEVKELKKSYKAKIKELNNEYKESQRDYNLRKKINGSTEGTDAVEKYKEIKQLEAIKKQEQLAKQKEKELKALEKQKLKEGKNIEKLKPQNQTNANEESVESSGN